MDLGTTVAMIFNLARSCDGAALDESPFRTLHDDNVREGSLQWPSVRVSFEWHEKQARYVVQIHWGGVGNGDLESALRFHAHYACAVKYAHQLDRAILQHALERS